MKKFFISLIIFLIGFSLGITIRFSLFWFLQTKLYAYKYIYKDLIDLLKNDKGGANTPEEAWLKYLDAMKKGDIDEALLYVWPQDREEKRQNLLKIKENNLLGKIADCDKDLIFIRNLKPTEEPIYVGTFYDPRLDKLGVVSKEYKVKCRFYKEIDMFLSLNSEILKSRFSREEIKQMIEEEWKNYGDVIENEDSVFIRYNPYTKKWFI